MPSSKINTTLATLPPSGIRKFFDIVAEMPDVVSLSVGEPDFDTPWTIREAALYAIETGDTHYTGNRGRPALLRGIADYYTQFGVVYDPLTEIIVGNGGSETFDIAIRAITNPGDEIIIHSPGYVMYSPLVQLAGGVPVAAPTSAATNWQLTPEVLQRVITPRTKALILNYPSNPTGATYTKAELIKLAKVIAKHDLLVISDEIYAELTYEGSHTAFAALPGMCERTLTVSGFSKAFAMTGFRLGYLAGPADIISAVLKIHQYSALCASSIAQAAGIEALKNGGNEVVKMRDEYRLRRDFVVRELNAMGLSTPLPRGAFYAFPSVARTGLTGEQFALQLLKKEKVAVVPGTAFAPEFTQHVRLSYATGIEGLTTALERMAHFVSRLKK